MGSGAPDSLSCRAHGVSSASIQQEQRGRFCECSGRAHGTSSAPQHHHQQHGLLFRLWAHHVILSRSPRRNRCCFCARCVKVATPSQGTATATAGTTATTANAADTTEPSALGGGSGGDGDGGRGRGSGSGSGGGSGGDGDGGSGSGDDGDGDGGSGSGSGGDGDGDGGSGGDGDGGSGSGNGTSNGATSSTEARWTMLACCDIGLVDVHVAQPTNTDQCVNDAMSETAHHAGSGLVLKISSEFGYMHASMPLELTSLTATSSRTVCFFNEMRATSATTLRTPTTTTTTTTDAAGSATAHDALPLPLPSVVVSFRVTAHSDRTRRDLMDLVNKASTRWRGDRVVDRASSRGRHFETGVGVDVLSYPHLACTDLYSFDWPHSSIFGVVVCEHATLNARAATLSTFFRTVAPYWIVMLMVLSVQCGVLYFVWQIADDDDNTSCEGTSHMLQLVAILVFTTQVYKDLWESVKMAMYIRWLPVADIGRSRRFLCSQLGLFDFVVDNNGFPTDFCRDVQGQWVFYVLVVAPKVAIASRCGGLDARF
jgi:hypothetical protein